MPADAESKPADPANPDTPAPQTHGVEAAESEAPAPPTADAQIADLAAKLREADQAVLRAQAEMENFRKRLRRDAEEERKYAASPLLTDLLDVLDHLLLAIESASANDETKSLREGVELVCKQFDAALAKHHCTRIEALGAPFDPHLHQALVHQPSAEHPAGTVTAVFRPGYKLHDRVLRPAQVVVSSGAGA